MRLFCLGLAGMTCAIFKAVLNTENYVYFNFFDFFDVWVFGFVLNDSG